MPKVRVNGRVLYADMTPVNNATVILHDLDLIDGKHDKIYESKTDEDGKFSGRTSEWKDREGKGPFGIDIPDILNLQFTVKSDSKTHKGPFILNGSNALPIVLPFLPPKPVKVNERELVQIILLSNNLTGTERALYEFIETSSEALVATVLGNDYNNIHVLKGNDVTLEKLCAKLDVVASSAGTKAVDLMMNIHGITDKLPFSDAQHTEADVLNKLHTISAQKRKKFRAVFSTACFGASHLDLWTNAGFKVACGSEGVYADSAVSFAPLLNTWAQGQPFKTAVAHANAADPGNANDNIVKAYYTATGRRATAASIDSDRIVKGKGDLRIYSAP